jgi:hypothetical protein
MLHARVLSSSSNRSFEALQKLDVREGFAQKASGALKGCPLTERLLRVGGHDDHPQFRVGQMQPQLKIEPIGSGQLDVRQKAVWYARMQAREESLGAFVLFYLIPLGTKQARQPTSYFGVIVDYCDEGLGSHLVDVPHPGFSCTGVYLSSPHT